MMLRLGVALVVVLQLTGRTWSLPTGMPDTPEACLSMRPAHGNNLPQTGPPPFKITTSKESYRDTDSIVVTLTMLEGEKLKGFAIQARRIAASGRTDEPVGYFEAGSGTQLVCKSAMFRQPAPVGNGLTHTNGTAGSGTPKSELKFKWTAGKSHGHIEFRVTVVVEFTRFWVAEPSNIVYDTMYTRPTLTPTLPGVVPVQGSVISVADCGKSKGCYRNPPGCHESNCDILVTWVASSDKQWVDFEMIADTEGWVAVGFSDDLKMGKDEVFECAWNKSQVDVRRSRNVDDGKNNVVMRDAVSAVRLPSEFAHGWVTNRRISCQFRVRTTVGDQRQMADLSSTKYHLLLAKGIAMENGTKTRHVLEPNKYPYVSVNKVGMTDRVDITSTARYILVKVHGCLMLIGWMMCASTALILAKYYKPMWPNDRICGERVWFAVHRGCMVICLFSTVIAFIIIFVHAGGYSQMPDLPAKAHPILGIITTILCIINPLIALCKCHDKSEHRPIFNWIHWFVGTCATVLATPTLFIGLNLPKAHVPWWATWVMVAFMLFHLVIELLLEIHGCLNASKQKYRTQEFEMRKPKDDREQEPVGKRFKKIIITLYVVVVIVLGLVMVISVAAG